MGINPAIQADFASGSRFQLLNQRIRLRIGQRHGADHLGGQNTLRVVLQGAHRIDAFAQTGDMSVCDQHLQKADHTFGTAACEGAIQRFNAFGFRDRGRGKHFHIARHIAHRGIDFHKLRYGFRFGVILNAQPIQRVRVIVRHVRISGLRHHLHPDPSGNRRSARDDPPP